MSRPLIWLSSDRLVMQARPRQMRPQISQRAAVLHGQMRKLGGGDDQRNAGEQAAEDGGHGDPAEGLFRLARLGHGVTFESGTG